MAHKGRRPSRCPWDRRAKAFGSSAEASCCQRTPATPLPDSLPRPRRRRFIASSDRAEEIEIRVSYSSSTLLWSGVQREATRIGPWGMEGGGWLRREQYFPYPPLWGGRRGELIKRKGTKSVDHGQGKILGLDFWKTRFPFFFFYESLRRAIISL